MFVIISGVSGSGKTTLTQALLRAEPGMRRVVTYTTRPPREGEVDGRDYHFVSVENFEQLHDHGEFMECANVYGNLYGTPCLQPGNDMQVLITDVQGFRYISKFWRETRDSFVSFYVASQDSRARLLARGGDVKYRLEDSEWEARAAAEFDYVVENDDLEKAVQFVRERIAERHDAEFTVYLSGGIKDFSLEERHVWRERAKRLLRCRTIDPTRTVWTAENGRECVDTDKADIAASRTVLVYYIRPSVGTSMEVLYAHSLGLPVHLVNVGGGELSPWLTCHCDEIHNTLEEACNAINRRRP